MRTNEGRHCHLEQPRYALSWKTFAIEVMPGHWAILDQCAYGCCCLDTDGQWRLVKKNYVPIDQQAGNSASTFSSVRWWP